MKFYVEIELGNDGMQTHADVSAALAKVAAKVLDYAEPPQAGRLGRILDENGNSVGSFGFLLE